MSQEIAKSPQPISPQFKVIVTESHLLDPESGKVALKSGKLNGPGNAGEYSFQVITSSDPNDRTLLSHTEIKEFRLYKGMKPVAHYWAGDWQQGAPNDNNPDKLAIEAVEEEFPVPLQRLT